MYTKNSQTEVIGTLVGSSDLAEIYVLGGDIYLARGHLAPNADFMTYAWQVRICDIMDMTSFILSGRDIFLHRCGPTMAKFQCR